MLGFIDRSAKALGAVSVQFVAVVHMHQRGFIALVAVVKAASPCGGILTGR
jgi:hypothetical protein